MPAPALPDPTGLSVPFGLDVDPTGFDKSASLLDKLTKKLGEFKGFDIDINPAKAIAALKMVGSAADELQKKVSHMTMNMQGRPDLGVSGTKQTSMEYLMGPGSMAADMGVTPDTLISTMNLYRSRTGNTTFFGEEGFVKFAEAAKYFGIDEETLKNMLISGDLSGDQIFKILSDVTQAAMAEALQKPEPERTKAVADVMTKAEALDLPPEYLQYMEKQLYAEIKNGKQAASVYDSLTEELHNINTDGKYDYLLKNASELNNIAKSSSGNFVDTLIAWLAIKGRGILNTLFSMPRSSLGPVTKLDQGAMMANKAGIYTGPQLAAQAYRPSGTYAEQTKRNAIDNVTELLRNEGVDETTISRVRSYIEKNAYELTTQDLIAGVQTIINQGNNSDVTLASALSDAVTPLSFIASQALSSEQKTELITKISDVLRSSDDPNALTLAPNLAEWMTEQSIFSNANTKETRVRLHDSLQQARVRRDVYDEAMAVYDEAMSVAPDYMSDAEAKLPNSASARAKSIENGTAYEEGTDADSIDPYAFHYIGAGAQANAYKRALFDPDVTSSFDDLLDVLLTGALAEGNYPAIANTMFGAIASAAQLVDSTVFGRTEEDRTKLATELINVYKHTYDDDELRPETKDNNYKIQNIYEALESRGIDRNALEPVLYQIIHQFSGSLEGAQGIKRFKTENGANDVKLHIFIESDTGVKVNKTLSMGQTSDSSVRLNMATLLHG